MVIFLRAKKQFFGLEYLNSLMRNRDPGIFFDHGSDIHDPGWKNFGSGIRDKHPRSSIDRCHKRTHIWLKFEKTFSDVGTIFRFGLLG
jgi:hypothetical protein